MWRDLLSNEKTRIFLVFNMDIIYALHNLSWNSHIKLKMKRIETKLKWNKFKAIKGFFFFYLIYFANEIPDLSFFSFCQSSASCQSVFRSTLLNDNLNTKDYCILFLHYPFYLTDVFCSYNVFQNGTYNVTHCFTLYLIPVKMSEWWTIVKCPCGIEDIIWTPEFNAGRMLIRTRHA